MLNVQSRMLEVIDAFEARTAGGAPTAAMVAEAVGVSEEAALVFLLDLVRQGILWPPRFARRKTRAGGD